MANIPKIDHKRERDNKSAARNRCDLIAARLSRPTGYLVTQKGSSARASALRADPPSQPTIPPKTHREHNLNAKGPAPPLSDI